MLIPEDAVEEAATRVHELLTREGWVLRHVEREELDWMDGLDLLRETLGIEKTLTAAQTGEIRNSYSPIIGEDESVTVECGPHRVA